MSDYQGFLDCWNRVVKRLGKGIPAKISSPKVQMALKALLVEGASLEDLEARAIHMIMEETWRRESYLTLAALQSSWESLGEEIARKRSKDAFQARRAQSEAEGVQKRRAMFQEPPMDKEPLREWLRQHCPGISSQMDEHEREARKDPLTAKVLDDLDGELVDMPDYTEESEREAIQEEG